MPTGAARFAHEGGTWFLRLDGELRHTLGPALNAVLDRAFADPAYRHCLVDLSCAESIDSTCLGILARLANKARETHAPPPTLISASEDITETLMAVCFDDLFNVVTTAPDGTPDLELVPESPADPNTMLSVVLEAHRRLCDLDARNAETFRDVLTALEERASRN